MSAHEHLSDQQFGDPKAKRAAQLAAAVHADPHVRMVPMSEVRKFKPGDHDVKSLADLSALSDHTRSTWWTPDEQHDFNEHIAEVRRIHTPLVASYNPETKQTELWDGHHRYWAARTAGLSHLPIKYDTEYGEMPPER